MPTADWKCHKLCPCHKLSGLQRGPPDSDAFHWMTAITNIIKFAKNIRLDLTLACNHFGSLTPHISIPHDVTINVVNSCRACNGVETLVTQYPNPRFPNTYMSFALSGVMCLCRNKGYKIICVAIKYIANMSDCRPQLVKEACNMVLPTPSKHELKANVVAYILDSVIRLFGFSVCLSVLLGSIVPPSSSSGDGNPNIQLGM
mmetsp:Transcript_28175/g.52902  ORF Transcript_28175/g.52902 Transcript_28175/m.52902 type:complete len:202 (+) Transcript_28175:409-1014(+)